MINCVYLHFITNARQVGVPSQFLKQFSATLLKAVARYGLYDSW